MFCVRKLVMEQRKQKYPLEYVYEKSRSEKFHPKETRIRH